MQWLVAGALLFQQAQTPEAALFLRIQAKVGENLRRLPNYTCSETIERFKRSKPSAKQEAIYTIRLEVAYVGGLELYGWPGSAKIDSPHVERFVPQGTSGNGDFAIMPRNVFLLPGAKSTTSGKPISMENRRFVTTTGYRRPHTPCNYRPAPGGSL